MQLTATLLRAHHIAPDEPAARSEIAPALPYFGSATFDEAKLPTRTVCLGARRCARCRRVLAGVDRLGSALFRDDDPRKLARLFDPADRDGCTVRLLAACIVLFGRSRDRLQ